MIEVHAQFAIDKFLVSSYRGDFKALQEIIMDELKQAIHKEAQRSVGEHGSYKLIHPAQIVCSQDTFLSSLVYKIDIKIERIVVARKIYII